MVDVDITLRGLLCFGWSPRDGGDLCLEVVLVTETLKCRALNSDKQSNNFFQTACDSSDGGSSNTCPSHHLYPDSSRPTIPLPYPHPYPYPILTSVLFPCLMTVAVRHFRFRTPRLFQDMSNA